MLAAAHDDCVVVFSVEIYQLLAFSITCIAFRRRLSMFMEGDLVLSIVLKLASMKELVCAFSLEINGDSLDDCFKRLLTLT